MGSDCSTMGDGHAESLLSCAIVHSRTCARIIIARCTMCLLPNGRLTSFFHFDQVVFQIMADHESGIVAVRPLPASRRVEMGKKSFPLPPRGKAAGRWLRCAFDFPPKGPF